jgi:Helix-turn-helix.
MQTLPEFLKCKENQDNVLEMIFIKLRERGEWGSRGLFARIGNQIGFSPAYVGQVLNGKKALTDKFLIKLSEYLGVTISYLKEELSHTEAQERLEDVMDLIRGGFEGPLFKLVGAEPEFSETRWTNNSPYIFLKLLQELANFSYSLSAAYSREKVKEMVTNKGIDLVMELAMNSPENIEN